jgi:hypothetical protein
MCHAIEQIQVSASQIVQFNRHATRKQDHGNAEQGNPRRHSLSDSDHLIDIAGRVAGTRSAHADHVLDLTARQEPPPAFELPRRNLHSSFQASLDHLLVGFIAAP